MKVYSIGRETGCDIVINDSTDVISRRHAILNVTSMGKMTIVDQSHNGTYVNGIRIAPNVPVPVTRKDSVSFAHVARLDWNRVPKSGEAIKYAIIAVVALAVIAIAGFGIKAAMGGGGSSAGTQEKPAVVADTTKTQKDEDKQKEEKAESKDDNKKDEQKADKKQTKKDNKQQAKDDKQQKKNDSKAADAAKKDKQQKKNEDNDKKSAGLRI